MKPAQVYTATLQPGALPIRHICDAEPASRDGQLISGRERLVPVRAVPGNDVLDNSGQPGSRERLPAYGRPFFLPGAGATRSWSKAKMTAAARSRSASLVNT